jgi:spermidine/putrescine-binding protein
MKKYVDGGHYIKITYKKLYEFFSKQKNNNTPYYNDFCNALYKHSLEVQEDLYQENLKKFLAVINRLHNK